MKNETLTSLLTQWDVKLSAKERIPNIYRLGHLLAAAANIAKDMDFENLSAETAARRWLLPDFPPVVKWLKQSERKV